VFTGICQWSFARAFSGITRAYVNCISSRIKRAREGERERERKRVGSRRARSRTMAATTAFNLSFTM